MKTTNVEVADTLKGSEQPMMVYTHLSHSTANVWVYTLSTSRGDTHWLRVYQMT